MNPFWCNPGQPKTTCHCYLLTYTRAQGNHMVRVIFRSVRTRVSDHMLMTRCICHHMHTVLYCSHCWVKTETGSQKTGDEKEWQTKKKSKQTEWDSSSLIWSMAVWLIGWFARNAANVNRQTSVKTTQLFLFQPVYVCLSEWICEWEEGRMKSCFCVFLFHCNYACVSVCREPRVCACWMVKDQHCMIQINTHSSTLCTSGWTEQRHTCLCIGMASLSWLQRRGGDWDRSFFFVDFKIMRFWNLILAVIGADVNWFELDFGWNGLDIEWIQSLMKQDLTAFLNILI